MNNDLRSHIGKAQIALRYITASNRRLWVGAGLVILLLVGWGYSNSQTPDSNNPANVASPPAMLMPPEGEVAPISEDLTAQAYFEQGMRAFNQGQYYETDSMLGNQLSDPQFKAAAERFQKAVEKDATFAAAWYYLAFSKSMLGEDINEVFQALNQAIDLKTEYAEAWFLRFVLDMQIGKAEEAKAALNRALEINPNYIDALMVRAEAAKQGQNWDGALTDLTQAKNAITDGVKPKQKYMILLSRGYVLYILQRYEEAISDLTGAIGLIPNEAYPYLVRANSYMQSGHSKDAIADFDQAIALNPLLKSAIRNDRALFEEWLANFPKGSEDYKQIEDFLERLDEIS